MGVAARGREHRGPCLQPVLTRRPGGSTASCMPLPSSPSLSGSPSSSSPPLSGQGRRIRSWPSRSSISGSRASRPYGACGPARPSPPRTGRGLPARANRIRMESSGRVKMLSEQWSRDGLNKAAPHPRAWPTRHRDRAGGPDRVPGGGQAGADAAERMRAAARSVSLPARTSFTHVILAPRPAGIACP